MAFLSSPLPWYISGPLIGLVVVGLYAVANQRLGVSTSYLQVAQYLRGRPGAEMWRVWFFVGMLCGSFAAGLLQGAATLSLAFGALGAALPMALLVPVLFLGGMLIGFGARWAGGCTSGHAISGTASLSPASWVTAFTFFATAVAVTLTINILTGGVL